MQIKVRGFSVYATLISQVLTMKIRMYKTIILPVVLYGCETWNLTLRKEHRLGVFEIRVLKWICGPKGNDVTGERRKLHNEELLDLYSSPSIIEIISRGG
jgi:hypothetical protein